MTADVENEAARLLVLADRLSRQLRRRRDEIARHHGLTGGRRDVLAACARVTRTVPQIARLLGQSRQSVQRTVDLLVVEGLCAFEANPDHKRSPRVRPSQVGRQVLSRMDGAEQQLIPPLGDHLEDEEVETAALVLATLLDLLGAESEAF